MTIIKGAAAAITGLALLAAPVAASANPAASLSVARTRAAAPSAHASKLGASVPTTTLISIGILAALTGIVLAVTGGDDDDSADSN
jgi:hypothetical protein